MRPDMTWQMADGRWQMLKTLAFCHRHSGCVFQHPFSFALAAAGSPLFARAWRYPADVPALPASTTSELPVRSGESGTVTRSSTLKSARISDGVAVQAM